MSLDVATPSSAPPRADSPPVGSTIPAAASPAQSPSLDDLDELSLSSPISVTLSSFDPAAASSLFPPPPSSCPSKSPASSGAPPPVPKSTARHLRGNRTKRKSTVVNKYCEEMNELNEAANSRPRIALIHSIQQENRHIRELQRENKELRLALEEHQNIMELIMSKYRQQIGKLKAVNNTGNMHNNSEEVAKIASLIERVNEMVAVMRKAALLSEDEYGEQQRIITTLATENKGLREMLQIAVESGSLPSLGVTDAHTQTESSFLTEAQENGENDEDELSPAEDELDSPNRRIPLNYNALKSVS